MTCLFQFYPSILMTIQHHMYLPHQSFLEQVVFLPYSDNKKFLDVKQTFHGPYHNRSPNQRSFDSSKRPYQYQNQFYKSYPNVHQDLLLVSAYESQHLYLYQNQFQRSVLCLDYGCKAESKAKHSHYLYQEYQTNHVSSKSRFLSCLYQTIFHLK